MGLVKRNLEFLRCGTWDRGKKATEPQTQDHVGNGCHRPALAKTEKLTWWLEAWRSVVPSDYCVAARPASMKPVRPLKLHRKRSY
jgi:hypothetical protein